ncbi:hypothetical protein DRJ22_01535 [Candidatus Woesearchaeota archaeon]|nr:MAG: hypothetical protein DRJ22_01535 [Candidatus Woesearchaeota archaeon]
MTKIHIPRILGILLVILTGLMFLTKTNIIGNIMKVFALTSGLILLFSKKTTTKKAFKLFTESFINKKLLLTTIIEILFWIITLGIITFSGIFLKSFAKSLKSAIPTKIEFLGVLPNLLSVQKYFYLAISIIIFGVFLWFLAYSTTRAISWAKLRNKKITKKYWLKFTLLNFTWWLLWTPIMILIFKGLKKEAVQIVFTITILLYLYLTPILHHTFFNIHKTWETIAYTLLYSITELPKFLIPYSFAFIVLIILFFVNKAMPTKAIGLLILTFFISWLRKYLNKYMDEIIRI